MKGTTLAEKIILILIILTGAGIISYSGYYKGKQEAENIVTKEQNRTSQKQERTYKKEYDSLQFAFNKLEEQKQQVKTVYIKGKEQIKYITKERIQTYTDTICKEDVINLTNHLTNADSLIISQDSQLQNLAQGNEALNNIVHEKEKQIIYYKNIKPAPKRLGLGVIGGYGTNFTNGLKPFVGVGVSYTVLRF